MSSDDEDRYPTIQHTRQRDLVEDDDDDVDIDDDEQYEDDMGDNNGDVMDGDEDGDDDEGDQRITAWGTQKKRFYREGDEDESEQAEEDEEEEAKLIEKLQQEQLSHENFFDVFGDQALAGKQKQKAGEFEEEDEEFPSFTLKAKFRSMEDLAESDKIALIQKESPELLNIIKEFKATLKEIKYKFLPLISYLREKKTTMKEGQRYIEIKFNLLTSYCINLSFYILLNSQGKSVKDHPVIKRLISLKTSLDRLKPLDKKLQGEINQILKSIEQDKALKPKKGKAAKQAGKNLANKSQGGVQNAKKSDKNLFEDANKGKKTAKNTENVKGKAALKSALKGEVPSGKAPKELLGKRGLADLNKKSVKFADDEDIDDEIDDDDMEGFGDDIDDDFGGEGFGDEDDGEDDFYKKIKNMKKVKRDNISKEKAEKKKEQFTENPKHFVGEEDSRRVTRKIEKNKGLTRHRGKTSGNARIKHKNRYQKAQHKLISKNIVVREKGDYYGGEKHISAGKIRSTKY